MPTPANLCSRCGKRLAQQAIRAAGKQFHPTCFICDSCKKPLEKSFVPRGERLYHPACNEKLFSPKCSHCGQSIQGAYTKDEKGRYHSECYQTLHNLVCCLCQKAIEGPYLYDGWGQKAHPEHPEGATGQCHVCARLMSPSVASGSKVLSDGRMLCSHCHAEEIHDFRQIQAAKLDVIAQMQAVGFDYIPDYIQVKLDEDQELVNQRLKASATGNIHGYTRTAQRNIPGYGLILEHSIHVLSGLPKVAFMGVLAHELLHVWINERPLKHLSHDQVEGFCNLGSALICQNAVKNQGSELAQVLLQRMEQDPDPAYGDGYRAMAWRLEKLGWPALIAAMHQTEVPLAEPEAERIKPRLASEKIAEKQTAEKPTPASPSATLEKLAQIKAKLEQQRQQQRPQEAINPSQEKSEQSAQNSATRVEVDPEVAKKIRERFAQRKPQPPKTGQSKPGGSKLGKLKKPGK
jgi:hypothetical protein